MLLVGDEESGKEEEWTKVQVEWPPAKLKGRKFEEGVLEEVVKFLQRLHYAPVAGDRHGKLLGTKTQSENSSSVCIFLLSSSQLGMEIFSLWLSASVAFDASVNNADYDVRLMVPHSSNLTGSIACEYICSREVFLQNRPYANWSAKRRRVATCPPGSNGLKPRWS